MWKNISVAHSRDADDIFMYMAIKFGWVDSEILSKNETLNKRIRTAEKAHIPYILVIGDEEVEKNSVALRDRRARTQSNLSFDEFIKFIKEKLDEVHFWVRKRWFI